MTDMPTLNLAAALPALLLSLWACGLLVADLFVPADRKSTTANLALLGLVIAGGATLTTLNLSETAFGGMYIADSFTALANLIVLVSAFVCVLIAQDYLARAGIHRGEYYPLLLMAAAGAMFMGAAGDLIIILIGLELLSLPLYVLTGFRRPELRSEEGAMKYFLLGAFATSFFVYGLAMVYGGAGTTRLAEIFSEVQAGTVQAPAFLLLGAGLILVALGFKVAAVPFHLWTPDVYQGAPTSATAYMSVVAKVGGFAALLRFLTLAVPSFLVPATAGAVPGAALMPGQTVVLSTAWQDAVAVMAGLSMILGNVVAILQTDLKRLLAYSSIAHAGYLLMAVAAAGSFQVSVDSAGRLSYSFVIAQEALRGALIYLMAYAFTTIGAFAVIMAVERSDGSGTQLDDVAGLGRAQPLLAGAMSIFMLSLIGIPLTGGFVGKWFVFYSAVSANQTLLVLIGVLTSAISAFYYLRVIVRMWFDVGEGLAVATRPLAIGVAICAVAVLVLGVAPALVTGLTETVNVLAMR